MSGTIDRRVIARLWNVAWSDGSSSHDGGSLSCVVYQVGDHLELIVQSATAVVVRERFALEPRALARAAALRAALIRRGWRDVPA